MKACRTCGVEKELDKYYKRPSAKDGYYNVCKECAKGFNKGWKETLSPEQKERYRRAEQAALYGLTLEQFEEMASRQDGKCYVCRGTSQDGRGKDRYLSIDHDHKCCPGKTSCGKCVRKLLCVRCNTLAGLANDDTWILDNMITYLVDERDRIRS